MTAKVKDSIVLSWNDRVYRTMLMRVSQQRPNQQQEQVHDHEQEQQQDHEQKQEQKQEQEQPEAYIGQYQNQLQEQNLMSQNEMMNSPKQTPRHINSTKQSCQVVRCTSVGYCTTRRYLRSNYWTVVTQLLLLIFVLCPPLSLLRDTHLLVESKVITQAVLWTTVTFVESFGGVLNFLPLRRHQRSSYTTTKITTGRIPTRVFFRMGERSKIPSLYFSSRCRDDKKNHQYRKQLQQKQHSQQHQQDWRTMLHNPVTFVSTTILQSRNKDNDDDISNNYNDKMDNGEGDTPPPQQQPKQQKHQKQRNEVNLLENYPSDSSLSPPPSKDWRQVRAQLVFQEQQMKEQQQQLQQQSTKIWDDEKFNDFIDDRNSIIITSPIDSTTAVKNVTQKSNQTYEIGINSKQSSLVQITRTMSNDSSNNNCQWIYDAGSLIEKGCLLVSRCGNDNNASDAACLGYHDLIQPYLHKSIVLVLDHYLDGYDQKIQTTKTKLGRTKRGTAATKKYNLQQQQQLQIQNRTATTKDDDKDMQQQQNLQVNQSQQPQTLFKSSNIDQVIDYKENNNKDKDSRNTNEIETTKGPKYYTKGIILNRPSSLVTNAEEIFYYFMEEDSTNDIHDDDDDEDTANTTVSSAEKKLTNQTTSKSVSSNNMTAMTNASLIPNISTSSENNKNNYTWSISFGGEICGLHDDNDDHTTMFVCLHNITTELGYAVSNIVIEGSSPGQDPNHQTHPTILYTDLAGASQLLQNGDAASVHAFRVYCGICTWERDQLLNEIENEKDWYLLSADTYTIWHDAILLNNYCYNDIYSNIKSTHLGNGLGSDSSTICDDSSTNIIDSTDDSTNSINSDSNDDDDEDDDATVDRNDPRHSGLEVWTSWMRKAGKIFDHENDIVNSQSFHTFSDLMLKEWVYEHLYFDSNNDDSKNNVDDNIFSTTSKKNTVDILDSISVGFNATDQQHHHHSASNSTFGRIINNNNESNSPSSFVPTTSSSPSASTPLTLGSLVGTIVRSATNDPFLLQNQFMHLSTLLIYHEQPSYVVGLILNLPTTDYCTVTSPLTRKKIQFNIRYGGPSGRIKYKKIKDMFDLNENGYLDQNDFNKYEYLRDKSQMERSGVLYFDIVLGSTTELSEPNEDGECHPMFWLHMSPMLKKLGIGTPLIPEDSNNKKNNINSGDNTSVVPPTSSHQDQHIYNNNPTLSIVNSSNVAIAGGSVNTDRIVWMCTSNEAVTAIENGWALPREFIVVQGYTVLEKEIHANENDDDDEFDDFHDFLDGQEEEDNDQDDEEDTDVNDEFGVIGGSARNNDDDDDSAGDLDEDLDNDSFMSSPIDMEFFEVVQSQFVPYIWPVLISQDRIVTEESIDTNIQLLQSAWRIGCYSATMIQQYRYDNSSNYTTIPRISSSYKNDDAHVGDSSAPHSLEQTRYVFGTKVGLHELQLEALRVWMNVFLLGNGQYKSRARF